MGEEQLLGRWMEEDILVEIIAQHVCRPGCVWEF